MSARIPLNLVGLGVGTAFGFLIQAGGFGDADFIHRMLLLQNAYPDEVFGAAVLVGALSFWLLERRKFVTLLGGPLKPVRVGMKRRHVYGGMLFGIGWGLSTTCPVPALAMAMGGGILGLPVMAGLFAGILFGDMVAHRQSSFPAPKPPPKLAVDLP